MRRALALITMLSACATAAPPTTVASTTTSASMTTTLPEGRPTDQQIGTFVANLVETLGTESVVTAVEEDPLPFVTSGVLMCELLTGGSTPTQVLDQFLNSFGPAPTDADSALAGALLGSAVNVFCPQHRQLLVDDLG